VSNAVTLGFAAKGIVVGLSIAAPVGPIGVLCIRRSLAEGQRVGFVTGLGAATADAVYGSVAAFGLTAVSGFLVAQKFWLGILGGLFLCYLGLRTFTSQPGEGELTMQRKGLLSAYLSTFALTLTNPMTVLSFVAIFAGLGLAASPDYLAASSMVGGVFVGSALWWLFLSTGAASFQSRLSATWTQSFNRLSGLIIFAFGTYTLSASFLK
jgi:threonine/homoserine/homoserine lactone efflux protein